MGAERRHGLGDLDDHQPHLMYVYVPYAGNVRKHTWLALQATVKEHDLFLVDVSSDEHAYYRLWRRLWDKGDTFCVVEHDIVVRADTFQKFDECANRWCCAPYPYLRGDAYPGLGCVRVRADLMRAFPDLIDDAGKHAFGSHEPKHWCTLDAAIGRELTARGILKCCHQRVAHLSPWPSHGCIPGLVTVVLTVYNQGALLRKAVDSVLSQTYTDWELVVMNDGSTDPEVERVLAPLRCDNRCKVFDFWPTSDERAATARYATLINDAVGRTSSKYVTFLCGDDYYMPDRLERMTAVLDAGNDVVYGPQLMVGHGFAGPMVRPANLILTDAYHRVDLNSVMMTREAFDQVGGMPDDPGLWRDADAHLWRRLTDAGYVFVPVPGDHTDVKVYRPDSVDMNVRAGKEPWGGDEVSDRACGQVVA